MDIIDFAKMIGGKIKIKGEIDGDGNRWVNASLVRGYGDHLEVIERGMLKGVFGRSEAGNIDSAIGRLARDISNQQIVFDSRGPKRAEYNVPTLTYNPE